MKYALTPLLALLLFMGCDETKKAIDVAGSVQLSGAYRVTAMNSKAMNGPEQLTINFSALDKSVRGTTGCNSYFGSYRLDLYALSLNDIASTEKACEEPIMNNENKFLQALNNVGSYALQQDKLVLYSKNDRSELIAATRVKNNEQ
ncbi:MAG: META domain-containing protein [Marinirhabdus sp.]